MAKTYSSQLARLDIQIKQTKNKIKKHAIIQENRAITALEKQVKSFNKEYKRLWLATLTAEQLFDITYQKALRQFDLRAHWEHRKVNHACATAIFAVQADESAISSLLLGNKADNQLINSKRQAFVVQWEDKKQNYLKKHTDNQELIEKNKLALEKCGKQQQEALEQLYRVKTEYAEQKIAECNVVTNQKLSALIEKQNQLLSGEYEQLPQDTVLKISNLCMYFGGLHAVEDLSFDVKKGEIFGLIGPNGAGKTTVFNCITQFYKPTKGELLFSNKENVTIKLTNFLVHNVVLEGISRTFQNVEVIKEVSVLENLLIAATRFYTSNFFEQALHLPILAVEEKLMRVKAIKVLELLGLSSYKDWYAYGLPYGILKKIEIARALMVEPKLIILDEPAAGLNDSETKELAKLIKRIRDEFNCTILLVEHDMSLVMSVCDRICAISFGKKLALGTPKEIQENKQVQEAYLGVEEDRNEYSGN